jgi:hypothetical protein
MSTVETIEAGWGDVVIEHLDNGDLNISRRLKPDKSGQLMVGYEAHRDVITVWPRGGVNASNKSMVLDQVRLDRAATQWLPTAPVSEVETANGPSPALAGLPQGVGSIFQFGMWFPVAYRRIANEVREQTGCSILHLTTAETRIESDVFYFNIGSFEEFVAIVDRQSARASDVTTSLRSTEAHNAVAKSLGKTLRSHRLGRLHIKRAISAAITGEFDDNTREELLEVAATEAQAAATHNPQMLGRLRDDINLVTLEVLIEQFNNALDGPGANHESTWQTFFSTNRFALQQLFSAPVTYAGEQVLVRIPTMRGAGQRVVDFLLLNSIARTAHVVEIKHPGAKLIKATPYRGSDRAEVFAMHPQLAGGIAQLQAQMESARRDLPSIHERTPDAPEMSFSAVRGAIIAGRLSELSLDQRASFLRLRDALVGIDILTFDEVLERLRTLHQVLAPVSESSGEPAHDHVREK